MHDDRNATAELGASLAGDGDARSRLLDLLYDDLRDLAVQHMRRENAAHTLQPTALVHEAFLRMIEQDGVDFRGRSHFMALASMAMRRVLVDHARARTAQKKGGGRPKEALEFEPAASWDDPLQLLAVDEALGRLAHTNPRQARVVELKFFGGLTLEETAAVLEVSRDTVKLDWRFARAWLHATLSGEE
ncbi:MAG: ECF-type sigma factor [Planctomycetota bacterium]